MHYRKSFVEIFTKRQNYAVLTNFPIFNTASVTQNGLQANCSGLNSLRWNEAPQTLQL